MNNTNHSIYTAADIEKYLTGKLTPAEMHAMEKTALDDPFLAEAMEGFEGMNAIDWKDQLAATHIALQNKEQGTAKVIPLQRSKNNWWKAAAAVLIIGGGAALTYNLINNKATEHAPIAKTEPVIIPPVILSDTIYSPDSSTNKGFSSTTVTVQPSTWSNNNQGTVTTSGNTATTFTDVTSTVSDKKKSNPVIARQDQLQVADKDLAVGYTKANAGEIKNVIVKPAVPAANGDVANRSTTTDVLAEVSSKNDDARKKSEPVAAKAKQQTQQFSRSFFAQVVGTDNAPLPFANINIKTENFGTYTDVKGNFRLLSSDSLITVEVRSLGFLPKTYTLNSNVAQNKIVLSEDMTAVNQTVIKDMGVGRASRRATLLKDSIVNVEPADGWDNYNTYVSNNIDIPDDILKRDLHGEMEISFTIQPNGAITNIEIDKSLCDNCDETAARKLIEQGPQWKTKKGKAGRARIKVQF